MIFDIVRSVFDILSSMFNHLFERILFEDRFEKIKDKVISTKFKDNLQGVYGYTDNRIFEKHKKAVLELSRTDN